MADISLSVGVRQSLSAIKSTASLQQQQQLKLATGKRVKFRSRQPRQLLHGVRAFEPGAGSLQPARFDRSGGQGHRSRRQGRQGPDQAGESAQGSARQALQSTSTTNKVIGTENDLTAGTLLTSATAGTFTSGKVIKVNGTTVLTVGAGSTRH